MKKRTTKSNRVFYATLAFLNVCVGVALVSLFIPAPQPPVVAEVWAPPLHIRVLQPQASRVKIGVPNRIVVPSVGIDDAVRTGSYTPENQNWTIDGGSAFFADRSVPANNSNGTTLLYGHGTKAIFGRIPDIQPGATATVYTNEGLVFSYIYQSTRQVRPSDTSVLNTYGPVQLVLQTCSGPLDSYRTLVAFSLVGVTNNG